MHTPSARMFGIFFAATADEACAFRSKLHGPVFHERVVFLDRDEFVLVAREFLCGRFLRLAFRDVALHGVGNAGLARRGTGKDIGEGLWFATRDWAEPAGHAERLHLETVGRQVLFLDEWF